MAGNIVKGMWYRLSPRLARQFQHDRFTHPGGARLSVALLLYIKVGAGNNKISARSFVSQSPTYYLEFNRVCVSFPTPRQQCPFHLRVAAVMTYVRGQASYPFQRMTAPQTAPVLPGTIFSAGWNDVVCFRRRVGLPLKRSPPPPPPSRYVSGNAV